MGYKAIFCQRNVAPGPQCAFLDPPLQGEVAREARRRGVTASVDTPLSALRADTSPYRGGTKRWIPAFAGMTGWVSAALLIAAPAAAQTAAQGETPSAEPPPIPVTIASPAQSSESPERIALARQLLEASGFRDQMRAGHDMAALLLSMMLPSILSQQSNGTDRLAEIERNFPGGISAFSERYVAHFRDRLDHYHPEIIERVATFYAERMTREQLEATLVFLETDSGKAWSGAVTGYVQLAATVTAEYDTLAGNEALDLITAELRAASTQTEEE